MPLSQESGTIRVIMHDPLDFETIDKLRFVLNREIEVALAPKEAIVEAINKYYGSAIVGDRVGGLDAAGIHGHGDRLRRGWNDHTVSRVRPTRWKKAMLRSSSWCT